MIAPDGHELKVGQRWRRHGKEVRVAGWKVIGGEDCVLIEWNGEVFARHIECFGTPRQYAYVGEGE